MIKLGGYTRTVTVSVDKISREIAKAGDFAFKGKTEFKVPQVEIENNFKIGLIVGPSGSGKSTLLAELEKHGYTPDRDVLWSNAKSIAAHFESLEVAQERMAAVGLNTIPAQLKPYHVLSNGQKHRADMARKMQSFALIDEYTSVVDRNVAISMSKAMASFIRRGGLTNIVFATCHYDIVEWLQPDWVFDTATGLLSSGRSLRRPSVELEILPCSPEIWPMFAEHHYLSANCSKGAHCWVAVWKGQPVGFHASLAFPGGHAKNAWRDHRTVVLPDYQGLGIGIKMVEAIAEFHLSQGRRFYSRTAHPRLGAYRNQSAKWKGTSTNGKKASYGSTDVKYGKKQRAANANRVCFSHEYTG